MISFKDLMLLASEAAIVSLGSLIVYVSMRAYRKYKSTSMLAMSLGFAVIVVASLTEEIFLELLGYPMIEAHIVENSIVAVGLLVIVFSIYGARG